MNLGRLLPLALALSLAQSPGCASTGPYVWAHDMPPEQAAPADYLIVPGDVVSVRVFNQENMSTRARVRSDGKLAIPFVGDVEVRGKAPAQVARDLEVSFKEFIVAPKVTVTVEEFQPAAVSVMGEVVRPGVYTVDPSMPGVLQALALAGGLTEFASRSSIFVLRKASSERIRFTYAELTQGEGHAASFRLRPGDAVVVE